MLPEVGVTEKKTHSSSVDDATANKVRDRIRGIKQKQFDNSTAELELPLPDRGRTRASATQAPQRPSSASSRPSIRVGGGGMKPFRPPVTAFRPPVQSKPVEAPPTAGEGSAAPVVETPPAAKETAPTESPAVATTAAGKPIDRPEDVEKPAALDIPKISELAERPDFTPAPGTPLKPPPAPTPGVAPKIPTPPTRSVSGTEPQRVQPIPSAPAIPAGIGPRTPLPSPPAGAQSQPTPGTAVPAQTAPAQTAPAQTVPAAPGAPRSAPPKPGAPTSRAPAVPGAPEPRRTPGSPVRPPVVRSRPIRPPGVRPPHVQPGQAARGRGAARPGAPAPGGRRPPGVVPGKPIYERSKNPAAPMPGLPTPPPGAPPGYVPRRPGPAGPGGGGLRPGMPPPGPGGPGRPGGGPGRPTGARRPRPGQNRQRDHEAEAERKILQRKRKAEIIKAVNTEVYAADGTTVKELAEKLGIKANSIIKTLVEKGKFATINQPLDLDSIKEIAGYFGATATELTFEEETLLDVDQVEAPEDEELRAPVVTIMGHVDHGKTSLLDYIRSANVADREAGGITQAIGAYDVTKDGKRIVFIDTPGHEAFTKMRAQGASVTDIVILVVAADDGLMPQTLEAIDHSKAANVPIIVAVNKIDLPNAQPDRAKQQLAERGLQSEDWGGDTIICNVSAKTGEGVDNLLEMINLVSELKEFKANPKRAAIGVVLEAKLDRGKGPVATVLTQNGTLKVGDTFIVGAVMGRVRAMMDDRGKQVKEAGPSRAVVVLGLDDIPEPGDQLSVVTDTDRAKKIAEYREERARDQAMSKTSRLSLEQFQEQLAAGDIKELPIILKADVQGSATVLEDTMAKLTSDKVKVRTIHSGVGAIKESDVLLAITANAIVVGFNVRPERSATKLAEHEGIDIRLHTVIYELIDELKKGMAGLLDPIIKEEFLGRARVLEIFHVSKVGTIAGCKMEEGLAQSSAHARLLRDNVVIHTGRLKSLKRFKDDVKEVRAGQECGMGFERYNDVKQNDEIELFAKVEVAQDINELIPVN